MTWALSDSRPLCPVAFIQLLFRCDDKAELFCDSHKAPLNTLLEPCVPSPRNQT